MAEVKTRRVSLDCTTRVFPEEAVDAQKQRRYRRIASCLISWSYPLKAIFASMLWVSPSAAAYRLRSSISTTRSIGLGVVMTCRDVSSSRGLHPRRPGDSRSRSGVAGGVPGIQMLGIPSMEVMESRGRIRCAMRSAVSRSRARAFVNGTGGIQDR